MTTGNDVLARLGAEIDDGVSSLDLPALGLAMTDRDRTVFETTVGFANLDARTKATPETLFQIGSVSKSFAALAVMREVEAGRLDLRAPVTEYLPWLRLRSDDQRAITLHGLLSHTSGLPPGMDSTPSSVGEVLALARVERGPPGDFRYSNVGYTIVGLVLERVTGRPIHEVLRRSVFEPAGMEASEARVTNDLRSRSAVGYGPADAMRRWRPGRPLAPEPWVETDSAAGSISSTPSDLAAYARLLLARGHGVVSTESFEAMVTSASALDEHGIGYGYGLTLERPPNPVWIGHSGSTVGFTAWLDVDLDAGLAVVAVCSLGDVGPESPPRVIAERVHAVLRAARDGGEPGPAPWAGGLDDAAKDPEPEPATDATPHLVAFAGHYRSHSPWAPGFWILARGDSLLLRFPGATEFPLTAAGDASFRLEDDVEGPARIEFGDVIDGLAARATCDGVDFYRVPW